MQSSHVFEFSSAPAHTPASYLAVSALFCGLVQVTDADEHLVNGLEQLQCWFDFVLRVVCLHCGAGDGDVFTLRCHVVIKGDHANVNVCKKQTVLKFRLFDTVRSFLVPDWSVLVSPCFLLTWFWGMMIWQDLASLVLLMG